MYHSQHVVKFLYFTHNGIDTSHQGDSSSRLRRACIGYRRKTLEASRKCVYAARPSVGIAILEQQPRDENAHKQIRHVGVVIFVLSAALTNLHECPKEITSYGNPFFSALDRDLSVLYISKTSGRVSAGN